MKLLWLGDFFYDYDYVAEDINRISKWIKKNNYYTVVNLEGTIDSNDYKKIKKRGPNLSSNVISIDVLKKLNVIGVLLANNHIMDYGEDGLLNTINNLKQNNIHYTGAGLNINDALKPMVISNNGKTIAVIGFGWDIEETIYATNVNAGCVPRDEKIIIETIKKLKKKYSRVVVMPHWGFEYNRLPMIYDKIFAHKIIDSGCDLIIGSHPHCVQAKEKYNGKSIYYSLGNFYFSSKRKNFNKLFDEKNQKQCDFGIGIITDFDLEVLEEILIKYEKNNNCSFISYENISEILLNIDNYDKKRNLYNKSVKKMKKNINPILDDRKLYNKIKLKKLKSFYKIKGFVKKIVRK